MITAENGGENKTLIGCVCEQVFCISVEKGNRRQLIPYHTYYKQNQLGLQGTIILFRVLLQPQRICHKEKILATNTKLQFIQLLWLANFGLVTKYKDASRIFFNKGNEWVTQLSQFLVHFRVR